MMGDQVVRELDRGTNSDDEKERKEQLVFAPLGDLLKAAKSANSENSTVAFISQDHCRLSSGERPAGVEPSVQCVTSAATTRNSSHVFPSGDTDLAEEKLSTEGKNRLKNLQQLKVKFLRLIRRLGYTSECSVAIQALYKLAILGGWRSVPALDLDNAEEIAMKLEAEAKDELDFCLNILVLGKTGVGKSSTINSIFGSEKVKVNAFRPETTSVQVIQGTVDGIRIRVIDTPGLRSSAKEQWFNRKVLVSVKKIIKKFPLDITLYVDRLDLQAISLNDLPLIKTITSCMGSSIWMTAILTLTHACSNLPDGPSASSLGYEMLVEQRSHIVQHSIRQSIGDWHSISLNTMKISLVENNPSCNENQLGEKVLHNVEAWRSQLLLDSITLKILSEAMSLSTSKPQDSLDFKNFFSIFVQALPLPYILSSLLKPRSHPELSTASSMDFDLDIFLDSDQVLEDEYDQLPPFKPLKKSQVAKLSKCQKKAYFEEYDYRVKLFQQKQFREELKRRREMKKCKDNMDNYYDFPDDSSVDGNQFQSVPLPDPALPLCFHSDDPTYRYRQLQLTSDSKLSAWPLFDPHGWDHDVGYFAVNVEKILSIVGRFRAAFTTKLKTDKEVFKIHLESEVSAKHGESGSSLGGFDIQTINEKHAFTLRGESKFKILRRNNLTAGLLATLLDKKVIAGAKIEDRIILGKRLVLVGRTGAVHAEKNTACEADFEIRLRDADYPFGQADQSLSLSVLKWRGEMAVEGNLQSQFRVAKELNMGVGVSLNNKQSGQITMRANSTDSLLVLLASFIPIATVIYWRLKQKLDYQ